ncbi:hypothetical protein [Bacillus sp. V5-8f]|uniref:hypothetical protein n=1 Tax=Bacillus sp. V5-8f TaxID=2053044 RepID=UPI00215502E6|nr:hypothetical protein [Bacillus sp. V5-8f]
MLFDKSKEQIKSAASLTKEKLKEPGLEISKEKTEIVDFQKNNFDFLGFTFHHWRERIARNYIRCKMPGTHPLDILGTYG